MRNIVVCLEASSGTSKRGEGPGGRGQGLLWRAGLHRRTKRRGLTRIAWHLVRPGTIAVEVEAQPQRLLLRVRDSGSGSPGGSAPHLRALPERERLGRLRPRPRHRPQAGAGPRRHHRHREHAGPGDPGDGEPAALRPDLSQPASCFPCAHLSWMAFVPTETGAVRHSANRLAPRPTTTAPRSTPRSGGPPGVHKAFAEVKGAGEPAL